MSGTGAASGVAGKYRGAQGLDPEFIAELEAQFGFDKPCMNALSKCWATICGLISAKAIIATLR